MAFVWLRTPFRRLFYRFLGRVWGTDEARVLAIQALRGLLAERPELPRLESSEPPYPDLGVAEPGGLTCQRSDMVIISARFRSGSTLLWNLFRHLDGFTSYYEPLSERRWFDPQQRGTRIDPTHRGVSDYWAEYEGLTELAELYDERWIERELYMGPHAWNPALKRYVEVLVEKAKGRAALQFNRIDFRLPWFRRTFPRARIVHLYRHPRDQWLSTLAGPARNFPRNGSLADFAAYDHYYLLNWRRDLKHHFPILDDPSVHPYQLHYRLWKLSFLFGQAYADYSLAFEKLTARPDEELPKLLAAVGVTDYEHAKLQGLISAPPVGKWKEYAADAWFRAQETESETALAEWLRG